MNSVRDGSTDLYRFFDANDRLLYVGISFSAVARASQHRSEKDWWPDVARMEVEHLQTRSAALAAESAAIRTEKPLHNVALNGKPAQKAPWRCNDCRRSVGLTEQDGFVQVNPWYGAWFCVCADCDWEESSPYWIDARRIQTIADIERWTTHLAEKNWFDQSTWVSMIQVSSTIPKASTSAYLAYDAWRDDRNRRFLARSERTA